MDTYRFPWSESFDRIFRNEGVTGSNPVSSTKHPGQGDFYSYIACPDSAFLILGAPQTAHKIPAVTPSFSASGSKWKARILNVVDRGEVERL
jgi:hypothetical protein